MILLFLFGVKKKKLTKRKNTGFRFEAAPEQFSSEAQELASLKQPALLFAEIHSYTFRLKTKAGFFISSNPCKMHDSNNSSKQSSLFVRIYSYTFRLKTKAGFFLSHRIPAKCTILIHRNNLHCSSESVPTLFAPKLRPDFFVSSNPCKKHDSNSSEQSSLFVRICSYTFRIKTEAGTFYLFKQFPTVRFRKSESNRREYRVVRTCHIPFRKGCRLPTYRQRTSAAWQ